MQAEEFARNYNSPLPNLRDPVLVEVRPFIQPGLGVSSSLVMSNTREGSGDIYTLTSAMSTGRASPLHVNVPLSNIPNAPIEYLNFTPLTPFPPSGRVVSPSVPVSPTNSSTNGGCYWRTQYSFYIPSLIPKNLEQYSWFHSSHPRVSLVWRTHSSILSISRPHTYFGKCVF